MRFPLRRNANVLGTLLTETLQILIVFSIMGWPFSGVQQCETKGMNAERVVQQQQGIKQQHHYQQQQQQQLQFHKIPTHIKHSKQILDIEPSTTTTKAEAAAAAEERRMLPSIKFSTQQDSALSLSSYSSLDTHDMRSTIRIIRKDYEHKSAPTSIARGTMAYTQQNVPTTTTTTTTTLLANEVTAHSLVPIAPSEGSNENLNGIADVQLPADIILYSSLASSFAAQLPTQLERRRVSKDIQHSSRNGDATQLPRVSSDSVNDSHGIDTSLDYVISEHITTLTHPKNDNEGKSVDMTLQAYVYTNTNNSNSYIENKNNNNNNSINININNTNNSNKRTQNDFKSLSLRSISAKQNMPMMANEPEIAPDTSLTSTSSALAPLMALEYEAATSSAEAVAAAARTAVASASLTSADLTDSYAPNEMFASHTNGKLAYERISADMSTTQLNGTTTNGENHSSSSSSHKQHLGSQRIALKTTAKTKTTLAAESHQHNGGQHNVKSQQLGGVAAVLTTAATGSGSNSAGRQHTIGKKVESKYVLPKPQKTDAPMLNYIFDTFSSANKHHHHDQRYGPHFEDVQRVGQPTNLTVQAGSSIHLNCRISLLQDKTVSWVRRNAQGENALDLLTVGLNTYTGDKRYKIEFQYPNNWRLKIVNVKKDDEAMYECQISTHPPRVIQINLFVNAPKVMIVDEFGDPLQEKYYEIDSTLQLSCVVRNVAMATSVVYWKHGDDVLNYDVTRGGISVKTELMDDGANSTLSIAKINKSDSGNYTCAISDFQNFSIVVHILNGESFAELHHGAAGTINPSACHQLLVIHCALISLMLLSLLLLPPTHTNAAHQHQHRQRHHQTTAPHIRAHR